MENKRALIFGGTTEGRMLAAFLTERQADFTLSAATEYGGQLAREGSDRVLQGRLDTESMRALFRGYDLILDATHPYAVSVTENIQTACAAENVRLIRVSRNEATEDMSLTADPHVRYFDSAAAAAAFLSTVEEPALLTIGVKDAEAFTQITNFKRRMTIRVLPATESLARCLSLGYRASQIICMQGPFSQAMNVEMMKAAKAAFLVTKDSGEPGGFAAKMQAVRELNATALVIARPKALATEEGLTLQETKDWLERKYLPPASKPDNHPNDRPDDRPDNRPVPRFPLFVDLSRKETLLVGGGQISERRVKTILRFTRGVTVISPVVTENLRALSQEGKIRWIGREYRTGDLAGAWLAVAATDSRAVNAAVSEEARSRGIFCSVADDKGESGFWFPGVAATEHVIAGVVSIDGDHRRAKRAAERLRTALSEEE
ncbi:MAG: precorrin-6A reductase [Clostridiales bacterium]|nr:precorrin-6A reductase [Clostridiales bacterium]